MTNLKKEVCEVLLGYNHADVLCYLEYLDASGMNESDSDAENDRWRKSRSKCQIGREK